MSKKFTQQNVGLKVKGPLGEDDLLLRSFHGEDHLSGLFHYQLELISELPDIDMAAVVGQPMTVLVANGDQEHALNGIVARFVQAGTNQRFTTYYAELRPWCWLLTLVTDSRIFQEKKVPEIIEAVFQEAGFSDFRNDLKGTYEKREYCVQYQETSWNFVSRLMEDEGIFYYFEHEDGKHTLVLADDGSAHKPVEGLDPVKVKPQESVTGGEEIITHLALEQQVTVGGYAMTDYNFEKPSGDLKVKVDGEEPKRQVYEYPGGYMVKGGGESRVKKRIEAFELPAKLIKGQGHVRGFRAGLKFEVTEHVRSDLNREYVLRWVSHAGNTHRYANTFEAFPSDVPFRPQPVTRKPTIVGAQTAKVVGKKGEEIFTDKYGRIKVQFHWDRLGKQDDKASCWIRVSQGWAGKGWGAFFLPRIGQEVIVTFLEGDPDRPLVTGAVYNAEQTVPYSLPGDMTKSTVKSNSSKGGGGYNEIRFEDKKDSEEIFVHAQKDMNVVIENDHTRQVLNDEFITIQKNRTTTIKEEHETLTVEKGDRKIKVAKGNETHEVKGKRTVKVTGAEQHTNDDNFTQEVAGDFVLKVKGNITIEAGGKISMKSGGAFMAKAGSSMVHQAGTSLTNKAGTSLTNKAGTTLTNEAGVSMTNKASASQTVDGGGMLTLKGGVVKIN